MPSASSYWLSQSARVGWFLGQYLLSNRLRRRRAASRPDQARVRTPEKTKARSTPTLAQLLDDIRRLLRRDWSNIRDGLYRLPSRPAEAPGRLFADALAFFADFPQVDERRRRHGFDDVRRMPATNLSAFPDYYLRNFHYQTDGYLSELSAKLYDQQVEVLFMGSADAMRRQALVPIGAYLRRRRGPLVHVDVGCGTGRFLESVLDNFPRLRSIGLDLSPYYLIEAARRLGPRPGLSFARGLAEDLPFADGSVDLLSCVYLLHEIPNDILLRAAREFARVLRPGGRLVLVDSLQFGDRPAWDGLLAGFSKAFHEPFYADYAHADLVGLFAAAGFDRVASELAFLSKIMVFDRRSTSPPGSGEENVGSDERTGRSSFIFAKGSLDDKLRPAG
jgi:ubiquinone/menaquinone biosynthesis C-methylase UbiE